MGRVEQGLRVKWNDFAIRINDKVKVDKQIEGSRELKDIDLTKELIE